MPPKIGYAVKTRKLSGALAGGAVLAALLVATGASASTSAAGSTKLPTGSVQVRLITGDIVNVATSATGRQTANVVSAHRQGPGGVFQTFNLGKDLYVVPESAAPYLGSTLDPALFDVTQLARHPQSSLHVHLSLRSDAGAVSLPGVALHRTSASSADGSLTALSARAFGLALASQAIRDHASPTHTTGLFRSVTRISPAIRSAAPAAAKPAATHTVTVKATDYNGAPDNGDSVNLYNVDDLNLFATGLSFVNGQAQATVPDGHYSIIGFFYDFNTGKIYETAIPQFTVSKDTTVSIKALDATSPVSITTPKPADPTIMSVGLGRTDALGASSSYSFLAGEHEPVLRRADDQEAVRRPVPLLRLLAALLTRIGEEGLYVRREVSRTRARSRLTRATWSRPGRWRPSSPTTRLTTRTSNRSTAASPRCPGSSS